MKDCGNCSLCCKSMQIDELSKPSDVWCEHCNVGAHHACTIYNERPEECSAFHCFWRAESWPEKFRPDRCKVIFSSLPGVETIMCNTDNGRPDAWKKKEIVRVIEILKSKGRPVIVRTKNDTEFFIPQGWTQDRIMQDIKTVLDNRRK